MARSGYEAVYEDLLRTPEARAVLGSLARWLSEASVSGYGFLVRTDHEMAVARTFTSWSVRVGPSYVADFRDDEYTKFRVDLDRVLDEDGAAGRILTANWGVRGRVGTRNCARDVGLRGRSGNRFGDGAVRPFSEALLEAARSDRALAAARAEAESRIVGHMVSTSQTAEFASRRRDALAEAASREVRAVLLKYREVPDSVLAEAVRGAAVEGVMDW